MVFKMEKLGKLKLNFFENCSVVGCHNVRGPNNAGYFKIPAILRWFDEITTGIILLENLFLFCTVLRNTIQKP
jgi:hypothetical protein